MKQVLTKLTSHCDAIVHVEAQMPDLSTSRALLIMQQPRVRNGMLAMKICLSIRGENAPAANNAIKTSLELILQMSLSRSSDGSIQTIHKSSWRLFM
jgi:hypothetical protein